MEGLKKLAELLSRENQRFTCIDTGWPKPGSVKHTAFIKHEVGSPLNESELQNLAMRIGSDSQLLEFYSVYGSVRLYCDTIGDDSAFYIAHPDEWLTLAIHFNEWIKVLDHEEREELVPKWVDQCAVIGEIPSSGNYILVATIGENSGKVFEFEHDGFEFIERGCDLSAYLEHISTVDKALMEEILTHTRYSDGVTNEQWLVDEYHSDSSGP